MISVTLDVSKFNAAIDKYLEYNRRDLAEIINTKAFFIALKAKQLTPEVPKGVIRSELLRKVAGSREVKGRSMRQYARRMVPRLYLILQARNKAADRPGLYGGAMVQAAQKFLSARIHSRGYLASGWLWAIRDLGREVPAARLYASRNNLNPGSNPTGEAIPAEPGVNPTARLVNRIFSRHLRQSAPRVQNIMTTALQRAFDEEAASMDAYVSKKLQERVDSMDKAA